MNRRKFLGVIGGAAAAWPIPARAQQPAMPVIGSLFSASPEAFTPLAAEFHRGLQETGYVEGQNLTVEYRYARGQFDLLPALAAELVSRQVAVIVTSGGEPAALAAKAATSTIPIVFGIGGDPVKIGLVASLNRPGGNATGISLLTPGMGPKQLEMLVEMVPRASVIAVLVNPNNQLAEVHGKEVQEAARTIGKRILILNAGNGVELDTAFATLVQQRAEGLVVVADPFFYGRRDLIIAHANRIAVPTIYGFREFATSGGLMSYGTSTVYVMRTIGNYTGQILKGAKPGHLPVMQTGKIDLTLNLKTAKALGIMFPVPLLGRADEVIE